MPLRDHCRPPLDNRHSREGLHTQRPAVIVQHLRKQLPAGYVAAPGVHSGSQAEIDLSAFAEDEPAVPSAVGNGDGGVATAVSATLVVETTLPDYDEYEVPDRVWETRPTYKPTNQGLFTAWRLPTAPAVCAFLRNAGTKNGRSGPRFRITTRNGRSARKSRGAALGRSNTLSDHLPFTPSYQSGKMPSYLPARPVAYAASCLAKARMRPPSFGTAL